MRISDWSSDVCSSDLDVEQRPAASQIERTNRQTTLTITANLAPKVTMSDGRKAISETLDGVAFPAGYSYTFEDLEFMSDEEALGQIGRASCRERVCQYV